MTFRDFQQEFKSLELEVEEEEEADRLEHIAGCVTPRPQPCTRTLTSRSLKARGKGAPKKKREKGRFQPRLFFSSLGAKLTATCRHRQEEEISSLADGRCMRYELYHYCIEEGHNIPDMTCLQSANLRYRGAVPLSHSRKGHGSRCRFVVT